MAQGYDSDGSSFGVNGVDPVGPSGPFPVNSNGIPNLALLIRNIVLGAEQVMSTITHFYALAALDYVQGPGMAPWTPSFADSAAVGPLSYYRSNAEVAAGSGAPYLLENIGKAFPGLTIWADVIADYVKALHNRRLAHEAAGRLCGGLPHARNWVPGGVTRAPDAGDCTAVRNTLHTVRDFIIQHYAPLATIATVLWVGYDNDKNKPVPGLTNYGVGAGYGNFLSYGAFNEIGGTSIAASRLLARGTVMGAVGPVLPLNVNAIKERTVDSHYDPSCDNLAPASGKTDPDPGVGYSWLKAPRYNGQPMEVGPLARMVVSGLYPIGAPNILPVNTLQHVGNADVGCGALAGVSAQIAAGVVWPGKPVGWPLASPINGVSVMDRHRARVMEALVIINRILGYALTDLTVGAHATIGDGGWLNMVDPSSLFSAGIAGGAIVGSKSLPADGATGYGLNEAPRGALGHWLEVGTAGRIKNYQCVVPTTWNGSPSDGVLDGPIEAALTGGLYPPGTNVSLVASAGGNVVPVEALRVVHSFDPCIACAVHVVDAKDKKLKKIR